MIEVEVHIPKSLHWQLHMLAEQEGCSINALANELLQEYLINRKAMRYLPQVKVWPQTWEIIGGYPYAV